MAVYDPFASNQRAAAGERTVSDPEAEADDFVGIGILLYRTFIRAQGRSSTAGEADHRQIQVVIQKVEIDFKAVESVGKRHVPPVFSSDSYYISKLTVIVKNNFSGAVRVCPP